MSDDSQGSPDPGNTDVFELIEALIAEVQEAKSVPLSGNVLLDRDYVIEQLQTTRGLPDSAGSR